MKGWPPRMPPGLEKLLKEDVGQKKSGRWTPRMYRIWVMAPLALLLAVLTGWIVLVLLGGLSGFTLSWWSWNDFGKVPPAQRTNLVRDAVTTVALLGAVLAGVYAYRKQRIEEAASHRQDAEGLSKRYQDSAEQLGHEKAAVRLAGVYSMARLADEWPGQRQTCIDVLCSYLRMPDVGGAGEAEVRRTVGSIINDRVANGGPWSDNAFDIRGAVLEDFELVDSVFRKSVSLAGASFSGRTVFRNVLAVDGLNANGCSVVSGEFDVTSVIGSSLAAADFTDCRVLHQAVVTIRPAVDIKNEQELELKFRRHPDFQRMEVMGEVAVRLRRSSTEQPPLEMDQLVLGADARVSVKQLVDMSKAHNLAFRAKVRARRWQIGEQAHVGVQDSVSEYFEWSGWIGAVPAQFQDSD